MSNIVIVGSGPAGVSAALYAVRAGVQTLTSGGKSAVRAAPFVSRVTLFTTGKSACTSCRAYSPLPSTATSFPR